MNSIQILDRIDEIAATASKNEKQALLAELLKDTDAMRVMEYTYSPFKTYGIRKLPEVGAGSSTFTGFTWGLLDYLSTRAVSGNTAYDHVESELNNLDPKSGDLLRRILRKDLRAGFSESSINKAYKGLIPEFPYMRCSLPKDVDLETWPWEQGVVSQEKADGMFANVDYEANGNVSIRSRQGTEFPMDKFAGVASEIVDALDYGKQYHGEFLVVRDGVVLPRQEGNGIMNHVINGGDFAVNERPLYKIWDGIPLECVVPKGRCDTPYIERFKRIFFEISTSSLILTHIDLIPCRIVTSLAEAKEHAVEMMKAGKEGSVIKHPRGIWRDTTSKDQVKIKLEFEVDLEVVGVVPGAVGTKNDGRAGSLTCETSDGALRVDVAVKNEKMRDSVDANPDEWLGAIMTVVANDIMLPSESNMNHSLFLPRFAEAFPRDKDRADDLPRVFAQKRAAIYGEELMKEVA